MPSNRSAALLAVVMLLLLGVLWLTIHTATEPMLILSHLRGQVSSLTSAPATSSSSAMAQKLCYYCGYQEVPECAGRNIFNCGDVAPSTGQSNCVIVGFTCRNEFEERCREKVRNFQSTNANVPTHAISIPFDIFDPWSATRLGLYSSQNDCTSLAFVYEGHSDMQLCENFFQTIFACVQANPTCSSFQFAANGCRTFYSTPAVLAYAAQLQATLPFGVTVTVTANQGPASPLCQTHTILDIDCTGVAVSYGQCHPIGGQCYLSNGNSISCLNAQGTTVEQVCCPDANSNLNSSTLNGTWQRGKACPCAAGGSSCNAEYPMHFNCQKNGQLTAQTCCPLSSGKPIWVDGIYCPSACRGVGSNSSCSTAETQAMSQAQSCIATAQQHCLSQGKSFSPYGCQTSTSNGLLTCDATTECPWSCS